MFQNHLLKFSSSSPEAAPRKLASPIKIYKKKEKKGGKINKKFPPNS